MPRMTLLVGPIASGKSTYAERRAREGALVVCDDALVLAVHGGVYALYTASHKPLYTALETAIITHARSTGADVVIDRGGRTRAQRTRFAALGRSLGFEVDAVLFEWGTPEIHARRRFDHNPRGLTLAKWEEVAIAHQAEFQPLTADEGLPWTTCTTDNKSGAVTPSVRPASEDRPAPSST